MMRFQKTLGKGQKCQLVTPRMVIEVHEGDLTKQMVEALIVPTNTNVQFSGATGVAGALSKAGGPVLQAQSKEWLQKKGTLGIGEGPAVLDVSESSLDITHILAIATPHFKNDCLENTDIAKEKLTLLYKRCFTSLNQLKIQQVALSGMATGNFLVPPECSASAAMDVLSAMFANKELCYVDVVRFVDLNQSVVQAFHAEIQRRVGNFLASKVRYCDIDEVDSDF